VRLGRRQGKDRPGSPCVEFEEAETQLGDRQVAANLLQRQGLNFTQFGRPAESAGDHITRLWLVPGDLADDGDRPHRVTAGIGGGRRVDEDEDPAARASPLHTWVVGLPLNRAVGYSDVPETGCLTLSPRMVVSHMEGAVRFLRPVFDGDLAPPVALIAYILVHHVQIIPSSAHSGT
jgi:hypothetical protein